MAAVSNLDGGVVDESKQIWKDKLTINVECKRLENEAIARDLLATKGAGAQLIFQT